MNTTTNPQHELALDFLTLHEGACSVPQDSALGKAFKELQELGKVDLRHGGTAGFINVYSKNFKPRFEKE